MTEADQIREQTSQIDRLRAEKAELATIVERYRRMHDNAQAHIKTLQGIIGRGKLSAAERAFK